MPANCSLLQHFSNPKVCSVIKRYWFVLRKAAHNIAIGNWDSSHKSFLPEFLGKNNKIWTHTLILWFINHLPTKICLISSFKANCSGYFNSSLNFSSNFHLSTFIKWIRCNRTIIALNLKWFSILSLHISLSFIEQIVTL